VSGGTNFLSNEEIRSLIFFLSYVYGIDDKKTELVSELTDYESFVDALNTILFSVESNTISILVANPTLDIKNILDPVILTTKGICKEDADIITKINKIRTNNLLKEPESIQDAFYDFLGVTNCVIDFKNGKSALNKKMMFNIGYFSQILQSYCNHYKKNNWERFLYVLRDLPENSNLESENDSFISDNPENLKLMTIHQAKGLEFPLVIIPSLVNKRFPNETKSRTLFDLPKSFFLYEPYDPMKEEENLFYVAATRARDGLILSKFQKYPTRSVKPSEFIGKIDHLITKINLLTDFEIDIKKGSGSDDGFHVIDYSSISTYVDCPERFNLRYIYGFEAEDIFTQKMGKIYHNAIAKINSFIKEKRSISNSDYRQIIEESWIKLKKDKSADDSMKFKVLKEIKRYHQNIQTDLKEVIAIEKPLGINFDNVRVRGRLDFLYLDKDDNIVLMDYKSRKLKEIEKTHVDLQLRAYALALDKEGCEVDRIVAYPVQEEKIKIAEGELPLHSSHKVDVEKSVSEFIGNVKAENFESSGTSSSFCAKCPYKMICSYDKTRSPCK
jgi:DNA helicase-2/ATP-dependent DNA helicase PcrA